MQPTLQDLIQLAKQAGEILRTGFGQVHQVTNKSTIDLVTEIDRQSEEYLVSQIHQKFPGHTIIGEEGGTYSGDQTDQLWYLDPLDGTANYVHGIPIFSVSIAFANQGQITLAVVYDPMADECYSAQRGQGAWLNGMPIHCGQIDRLINAMLATGFPYDVHQTKTNLNHFCNFVLTAQAVRRLGSAALDLCYVGCGRLDGYWELNLKAWDVAAGVLIAMESGAKVTNPDGSPFMIGSPASLVAANPSLITQMLEVLSAKS